MVGQDPKRSFVEVVEEKAAEQLSLRKDAKLADLLPFLQVACQQRRLHISVDVRLGVTEDLKAFVREIIDEAQKVFGEPAPGAESGGGERP